MSALSYEERLPIHMIHSAKWRKYNIYSIRAEPLPDHWVFQTDHTQLQEVVDHMCTTLREALAESPGSSEFRSLAQHIDNYQYFKVDDRIRVSLWFTRQR